MNLFNLGLVGATPAALQLLQECGVNPKQLLDRHAVGDWGDLNEDDYRANVEALEHEDRLLSVYNLQHGKVYIITEADRSSTTLLLAEEY